MDLKPYKCECCGGRINIAKMVCEYCGTPYKDDSLKQLVIRQVRPGEHCITAEVRLQTDDVRYDPEGARDYTLRKLREQIADGLLGYMKVTTCNDFDISFLGRTEIIRGEVRVIDPMFEDTW